MSTSNTPTTGSRVISSGRFWLALIAVVVGTCVSAWLSQFYADGLPNAALVAVKSVGALGVLVIQLGALVVGLLRVRKDRPLGLGLLWGLLVIDGGALILGLCLVIFVQMFVRNF